MKGQYTAGAVAMQTNGKNDNGSAFFIATGDDSQSLLPQYNLFGYVESGLPVAQQIAKGDAMRTVLVEED